MTKILPYVISSLIFAFWIWGIFSDPYSAPISGWFVWAVICISLAIPRKLSNQPAGLWFFIGIGNIFIIILILVLGGRNFAFMGNVIVLSLSFIALVISLVFGAKRPELSEFCAGLSLAIAYIPQFLAYATPGILISSGIYIAMLLSLVNSIFYGFYSLSKVGKFGIGNHFALYSALSFFVFLTYLKFFWLKSRTRVLLYFMNFQFFSFVYLLHF